MTDLLLDHLWQSTLFAAAAGLLALAFTRNSAGIRYWLWFAASVKFLIPFSAMTLLGSLLFRTILPTAPPPIFDGIRTAVEPFTGPARVLAPATTDFDVGPWLLALWAFGVAVIVIIWAMRWLKLRAMLRTAAPLAIAAPLPVKSSSALLEPGLVGIFRPVLLLPEGIAARLTQPELDAVLAHELCHLRRHDNLLATIHMAVAALFWFHPLVWWIGARLIEEREQACDETVIETGTDPQTYAEGILKVCRLYLHSPLACAAGISGADLKKRMETIMENRISLRLTAAKKMLLAGCATITLVLPIASGMIGTAALAQSQPSKADIARALGEQAMPRTAIAYNSADFDKYVGYYQLDGVGVLWMHRDGNHLWAHMNAQPDLEVFPESPMKFFAKAVNAQFSFDSAAAGPEAVLHQGGLEFHAHKISDAVGKSALETETARIKNQVADPARGARLRQFIEADAKGAPAFDIMSPLLAAAVRQQQPMADAETAKAGKLKSVTFVGVGPGGNDIYKASYENMQLQYRVGPLTADGKLNAVTRLALP